MAPTMMQITKCERKENQSAFDILLKIRKGKPGFGGGRLISTRLWLGLTSYVYSWMLNK